LWSRRKLLFRRRGKRFIFINFLRRRFLGETPLFSIEEEEEKIILMGGLEDFLGL